MEIRSRSAAQPFTTKDGSTIRSLLDLSNAPVQQQSLAEATLPTRPPPQRCPPFPSTRPLPPRCP